jgi:hypothetical protein
MNPDAQFIAPDAIVPAPAPPAKSIAGPIIPAVLRSRAPSFGSAFLKRLPSDGPKFAHGFYRLVSRPFFRPVGSSPDEGTHATTTRINETVDGSVFERWRADGKYRSPNLAEWAKRSPSIPPC